jgi:hypothetical protein
MKRSFVALLICFVLIVSVSVGLSFNIGKDVGGHETLADKSIELKKKFDPGLEKGLNTYGEKIKAATSAEDAIISNEIFPRWMNHFYNPVTGKGLPYFENAQVRGTRIFNSAVDNYCASNKGKAWDEFGHVLHLLQDMGSPSHVHNASHVFQNFPLFSSWGFENYEWVESRAFLQHRDMSDQKCTIMFKEEAKRNG